MKKVGKTTTTFRYDLNQILYNYTVEVKNGFKELDLIARVPEELWMEVHDIVKEAVIEISLIKRNAKRQNVCLRRPRPETMQLLEENIGKTLSDIHHSRILYDPPPRILEYTLSLHDALPILFIFAFISRILGGGS